MDRYNEYEFFWGGPFSQWYKSSFTEYDLKFNTAEQFMMYRKAMLFQDFNVAKMILKESNPRNQKALGRQVKNFNVNEWNKVAREIVYQGNRLKFTQNLELKKQLLATEGRLLVEASPFDNIWGIGLSMKDTINLDRRYWKGTNWLGKALTKVREDLLEEEMLKV